MNENILDEITSQFGSLMLTENDEIEEFHSDWTHQFHGKPSAILRPNAIEDVKAIIQFCSKNSIKLVPCGGRTNLVGSTVANQHELIIDLSHLDKISEVDTLSQSVWVQAGVITEKLNDHLKQFALQWPVDLAAKGTSQIGGNLATNAGGINVVRYGMARNWVRQIRVLTMQGEDIVLGKDLEKDNTGYDLKNLFIGSEGTLGIIVEANLKLTSLPKETETYLVSISSINDALSLMNKINDKLKNELYCIEYISSDSLKLVCDSFSLKYPFNDTSDAVLLEVASSKDDVFTTLEPLLENQTVLDIRHAQSSKETELFWKYRHQITEALHSRKNKWVAKFDISIPHSNMEEFLNKVFTPEYATIYVFGHLGDGNLHLNILFDDRPSDYLNIEKGIYEKLTSLGGSISAEHGIGLLKKSWLHLSRSSEEIQYMKAIKKIFDPQGLLNSGKIFD